MLDYFICSLNNFSIKIMDIIIQTGFEKISHSIDFHPQAKENGKYLNSASHICYVKEYRRNGFSFLIECYSIRQTSVNDPPYKVQLYVSILEDIFT